MQAVDLLARLGNFTKIHGDPQAVQVSRVDVLQDSTLPFPGTFYLCEDVHLLMGWLTTHRRSSLAHQQIFILPAGSEFRFPFALPSDLLVILHAHERLPLVLSAQILQVLHEETPSVKIDLDYIRSEIVSDLLRGTYSSIENLLARSRAIGLHLERKCQVIVIEPDDPEAALNMHISQGEAFVQTQRLNLLHAIHQALTNHSPHHLVSLHGSGVVVLLDERTLTPAATIAQALSAVLVERKRAVGFVVTIGNLVKSFRELVQSYHEALAALEVSRIYRVRAPWVSFESLRMLIFVHRLQDNAELRGLLEGGLEPLRSIEPTYRRALLESLAAYIEHSHSVQAAAKVLGIHPNTLKYRIRRLEELLDLRHIEHERQLLYYLAARIQLLRIVSSQ